MFLQIYKNICFVDCYFLVCFFANGIFVLVNQFSCGNEVEYGKKTGDLLLYNHSFCIILFAW